MNKLFKKISMAFVGIAMAVGVGVAVGTSKKAAVQTDAATTTGTNVTTTFGSGSGQFNAGSGWSTTSSGPQTDTSPADSAGQTWTVSYNYSTYSRSPVNGSIQFGKKNYAPTALTLTSSAFTTAMKITAFSCQYGGAGGTSQGKATLKAGDTVLSTGSLVAGANDRTVSYADANGTLILEDEALGVVFSDFTADSFKGGGIKIYWVKYTLIVATTQHSVNYDKNTSDTVTGMPSPGSADENSTFTLESSSTPARAGYTFAGWGIDTDSVAPSATVDVGTSDVTVYAIWKAISGVTVSEKTALTGNMRGQAYYEVQASVGGDAGVSQNVTWSVTASTTYGTGASISNVASIDSNGKIIFEDNATVYAWATAADGSTHNTTGFAVTASGLHGSSTNPYTVEEARAAIDAGKGLTDVYVSGIISQVDTYGSNSITYWISDDGTTTNQFEVYKGKALNNTNFTAKANLNVGDIVTVRGTIKKYNSIYEFDSGNYQTAFKRLNSISLTVSEEQRTFAAGGTFAYAGTVTGNYVQYDGETSAGSAVIDNSKVSFHLNDVDGTEVTTSTVLKRSNNGNAIYVVYNGKSASYSLIVNDGPVAGVTLSSSSATIIVGATFDTANVTVTVNDEDIANPGYEWLVYAGTTTAKNYTWAAGKLTASSNDEDAGIVTLRARSTSDNSKYADFTLTISADAVVHLVDNELEGFTTKTIDVEYDSVENMSDPTSYAWTITSGSDKVSIKEGAASATLTLNCVAAGEATVKLVVSDGNKEAEATASITVTAYSVTAVNWSATSIKAYAGSTLTTDAADAWDVRITSNAGETNKSINHEEFAVKLGGVSIDLPHTWVAADDGKTLCVEYFGTSSSVATVRVVQTLNAISKQSDSSNLVFTSACGGSGTADDSVSWSVTSDAAESNFDSNRGIHYGTAKKDIQYLRLTSASFGNVVTAVIVNTTDANGTGSLTVKVGTTSFKCGGNESVTVSSTQSSYTFVGSATGAVDVKIDRGSAAVNAIYAKSVSVIYQLIGGPVQIANASGHEDAQYYVVKFAKAFNEALGATENCSSGLESAWDDAAEAYDTFLSDISGLSAAEQKYAKSLIANATAKWTEDTDANYAYCLERALKTYEACVSNHGLDPFMSGIRVGPQSVAKITSLDGGLNLIDGSTALIIVIISSSVVIAAGSYFIARKRRSED